MVEITCDNCGVEQEDGNHWIHVSVFHHDDPENPERWDRDNPRNFAASLCADCGGDVIDAAGGES